MWSSLRSGNRVRRRGLDRRILQRGKGLRGEGVVRIGDRDGFQVEQSYQNAGGEI